MIIGNALWVSGGGKLYLIRDGVTKVSFSAQNIPFAQNSSYKKAPEISSGSGFIRVKMEGRYSGLYITDSAIDLSDYGAVVFDVGAYCYGQNQTAGAIVIKPGATWWSENNTAYHLEHYYPIRGSSTTTTVPRSEVTVSLNYTVSANIAFGVYSNSGQQNTYIDVYNCYLVPK